MSGWQRIKSRLATPTLRWLLRRPNLFAVREQVARRYLRGDGIEVGALNAPLSLPWCRVRYVDCAPLDVVRRGYPDVSIQPPDIVSDLETLVGIDDASVDFVVANHVLEHVEDPLRALVAISRVLTSGGFAFIALPDKRFTFDRARAITPLWHIVRDFRDGPQWSRHAHYRDWARHVDRAMDVEGRAAEMERHGQNIHFHVWDFAAMSEMFDYALALPDIGLTVAHSQQNRSEAIWVLHKPERDQAATRRGSIAAN